MGTPEPAVSQEEHFPVICYHYPCPDGIFAALAAFLHFNQAATSVRWVPNRVFDPVTVEQLQLKGDETVYLLDFAGPPGFAVAAAQAAHRVVILDHHKTAAEHLSDRETLPANVDVHFDMERSGAVIAYDYFQPQQLSPSQVALFRYIEDADLWRWHLKDSKQFHAGLGSLNLEYDATKNPGIFKKLLQVQPAQLIDLGRDALQDQEEKISAVIEMAYIVQLGGNTGLQRGWGRCLAVTADHLSHLRSQLGTALAEESARRGLRPVGVVAYREAAMNDASKIKLSLRSLSNEDTTVISEAFGGGGHKNASSCVINDTEYKTW